MTQTFFCVLLGTPPRHIGQMERIKSSVAMGASASQGRLGAPSVEPARARSSGGCAASSTCAWRGATPSYSSSVPGCSLLRGHADTTPLALRAGLQLACTSSMVPALRTTWCALQLATRVAGPLVTTLWGW